MERGSEKRHLSPVNEENESPSKKVKANKKQDENTTVWTLEEKQRFVTALNSKYARSSDGNVNWAHMRRKVASKTSKEVRDFARYFNSLEEGAMYREFEKKAVIDVWKELAQSYTKDNIAESCIPQAMTVSALEPIASSSSQNEPNYKNIYNYISAAMRGTPLPELQVDDAAVVLEMLEEVVRTLSQSDTLIQRDFMHHKYAELTQSLDEPQSTEHPERTSTNPFGIPFDMLAFTNYKI